MVSPNWGLQNSQPNALSMFQFGASIGEQARERKEREETRNALTAYVQNPDSPDAMQGVIAADPRLGLQLQGQQQLQQARAQEQKRADLPLLGRLLQSSTDEASYQRNRMIAQEYGIDLSSAPANFDPAWRDAQLATVQALQDPAQAEALSTAGKIAMDMGLRPGTPEFAARVNEIWRASQAKPYVVGGETRLYTPRLGGVGEAVGSTAIAEGATATNPQTGERVRFQGGQWVPMGGGSSNATGGFQGQ